MAHSVACALRLTRTDTRTDTFDIRMRRGTNEVNSNVSILVIRWMLYLWGEFGRKDSASDQKGLRKQEQKFRHSQLTENSASLPYDIDPMR